MFLFYRQMDERCGEGEYEWDNLVGCYDAWAFDEVDVYMIKRTKYICYI